MATLQRIRDRLLILLALAVVLYLGRTVLIPLAYSVLVAMVLHPFVARLQRRGVAEWAAIGSGLLGVTIVFAAVAGLFLWELNAFRKDLPLLLKDARTGLDAVRGWLGEGPVKELLGHVPEGLWQLFMRSTDTLFGMLFDLVIIPVLTALLLFNRQRLVQAARALAGPALGPRVPAILHRAVHQFSAFILGMVKVYAIVGALNSMGLWLLGVPNALLFGMLTAVMTIIPYVGIVVSALLPISMAWLATGSLWQLAGVVMVFAVVQYLEANIIFPRVVGSRLGLNTLASIVIILAGAVLWGVSGMILSLPFTSIVLMASEEIPQWAPLRLLLSNASLREA